MRGGVTSIEEREGERWDIELVTGYDGEVMEYGTV